jgi:hypothetical protein
MDALAERVRDNGPWKPGDTPGPLHLNRTFWNFMYNIQALSWKYNANSHPDMRNMMNATRGLNVFCTALAGALKNVIRQLAPNNAYGSPDLWLKTLPNKFITIKLGRDGVDPNMVGNVKTPTTNYNVERRCYFRGHAVLVIQRNVYDPTMGMIVAKPTDLIWKSCKDITDDLKEIEKNKLYLKRILTPRPPGFQTGFVITPFNQLSNTEKRTIKRHK